MATQNIQKLMLKLNGDFCNTSNKESAVTRLDHDEVYPLESRSSPHPWPNIIPRASTNDGKLCNLRPKSPPLVNPNSGVQCVPRSHQLDKISDHPVFPKTSSVKSRLRHRRLEPAKTPRYDPGADLLACRTRNRQGCLPLFPGTPKPTRIILTGVDCAYESPIAIYKPRVQLSEVQFSLYTVNLHGLSSLRHCPPIEQLDNCTIWTQLSYETAEMLYEIDRLITSGIEDLLMDKIADLDKAVYKQASTTHKTSIGSSRNSYLLSFSIAELTENVLERLQLSYYRHKSTQSPKALRELFLLYLLSRNNIDKKVLCGETYGTITLTLQPSGGPFGSPYLAQVVQRSDSLLFPGLDILPCEGSTIEIRPRYHRGVFDEKNDSCSQDVTYSITDLPSWLHWDEKISGWTGVVPMYSELRGMSTTEREIIDGGREGLYAVLHLVRLEVKGILFDGHSSLSVGLKRTVRARLTLKIIPWYAAKGAQSPLLQRQHESYSQNDSEITDLKFQGYLASCQEALEPRSGEYRVSQKYDIRNDKIDKTSVSRQGTHDYDAAITKSDYDPPGTVHNEYQHADHLPTQSDCNSAFILHRRSELQYGPVFQNSSDTGSSHELCNYLISDIGLPLNNLIRDPILSHQAQRDRLTYVFKSPLSETSENFLDNEYCQITGLREKHPVRDRANPYDLDDRFPRQDDHQYENGFSGSHERKERCDSLQCGLFKIPRTAQIQHQTNLKFKEALNMNATEDEHCSPLQVSGSKERSVTESIHSDIEEDGKVTILPTTTNDWTENTDSPPKSSRSEHYATCSFNCFTPLQDFRAVISSSRSTSSLLLSDRSARDRSISISYAGNGDRADSLSRDTQTVMVEGYGVLDSGCYMADNETETDDKLGVTNSTSQQEPDSNVTEVPWCISNSVKVMSMNTKCGSSGSTSDDAFIQQTPSVQGTHRLGPTSRHTSIMELLPFPALNVEPSPPYLKQGHEGIGLWQMESFDDLAADPFICQEQALLWNVLTCKENADNAAEKDPKLEAEELKGLWEVLKYEARRKQRKELSDDTLGVESGEEDFASESDEEKDEVSSTMTSLGQHFMQTTGIDTIPTPTDPSELRPCKKCGAMISTTQGDCPVCGTTQPWMD